MAEILMPVVKQFLKDDDWPFSVEKDNLLKVKYKGDNETWNIYIFVDEAKERVSVISTLPNKAALNRRDAVAEFLTRTNYNSVIGFFQIDFDDGEVRFVTDIDVEGSFLSSTQMKNLLYTNVLLLDKYFPGIVAVMNGAQSAKNAFEKIAAAS
jgi:hypothetical protein